MSAENAIVVSHVSGVQVGVDDAAVALRDEIIQAAKSITSIADREGYVLAVEVVKAVKDTLRAADGSLKIAKAPINEISNKIHATAKAYCAPLDIERDRLGKLIISFEQAEARKRMEEERKQREEEARIRAEADRAAKEAAAAAAKAAIEQTGSVNRAEEAAIVAVNEVKDAAAMKIAETKQVLANAVTEKAKGLRRTTVTHFEIVDEAELFKARPDLFSPDDSKIRAALKITKVIPGMKVWEETRM